MYFRNEYDVDYYDDDTCYGRRDDAKIEKDAQDLFNELWRKRLENEED